MSENFSKFDTGTKITPITLYKSLGVSHFTGGAEYTVHEDWKGKFICDDRGLVHRGTLTTFKSVEYTLSEKEPASAFETQVGGDHYKALGVQPLELTLQNLGYEAFKGACYTKINKYTTRKKDNEVEQLKKARHVLDMWIEQAEKEQ